MLRRLALLTAGLVVGAGGALLLDREPERSDPVLSGSDPVASLSNAVRPRFANVMPAAAAGVLPHPLGWLAPPGVSGDSRYFPASGEVPEEIVLRWFETPDERGARGVIIWHRDREGLNPKWRVAYDRRIDERLHIFLRFGDVTDDGHDDVLVDTSIGSGGCGFRRVLATVGGRVREIYRSQYGCETIVSLEPGVVRVGRGVGPCPYADASAHCSGGSHELVLRWDGRKLVRSSSVVRCRLPELDPERNCARS